MKSKMIIGIMLTLLFIGMLTLAFKVQPVKASGTIYIRADGSIDPSTANITSTDNVTYYFNDNNYDSIVVEKDNIVVDGARYTVQGTGSVGIDLSYRNNVTIKNVEVTNFNNGIYLYSSSNNTLAGNNASSNNNYGIYLDSSSDNTLTGNIASNNYVGIHLYSSSDNTLTGNTASSNIYVGIRLENSSDNTLTGNIASNNFNGIYIISSSNNNVLIGNTAFSNIYTGIRLISSSDNTLTGNTALNNENGIHLERSSNNTLTSNNASNNRNGIYTVFSSNNNVLAGNTASSNNIGIYLGSSSNSNILASNNASSNNNYGIFLSSSSGNTLFLNNFINNTFEAYVTTGYVNTWDNGYPSGGNYWSNQYNVDGKSGHNQDQPGSDGIGDYPYFIDANNTDRYPLMRPWPMLEHELIVSIMVPASITLGDSTSLNATVTNNGLNDETNVEMWLLINDTMVDSISIPLLQISNSYTLRYQWTPTDEGTYNVTTYARPMPNEASVENNQMTKFVTIAAPAPPPEVQVGVKAGDWIKYDYVVTGESSGTILPTWMKVEFLSVEGTNATVRVTMHMSDGTEQSDNMTINIVAGEGTLGTFSGFVIPTNRTTGDSIYINEYGNITIAGETTRTYAGAERTVVYTSFSQYGTQFTYYWDKQTGVMVEASATSAGITGIAKATKTNMWEAVPPPFWMEKWLWTIILVIVILGVGSVVVLLRRRKPPLPEESPPTLT